jgi:NitT/TauT family transport system substrate-binding protein
MKKIFLFLIIFILFGATACNTLQKKELEKTSVRLKWLNQAQFAGIYVAKEKGFYEKEGLDVEIKEGGVDSPSIQDVLSGNSDFGIAGADDLIVAVSKGNPIKAVAVIYKISPVTYFSLKEKGIEKPQDLIGKNVGIKSGTGTTYSYYAMLKNLGIDKSKINERAVGYDLNMLYNGTVDVWPGFRINEPLTAIEQGYEVNELYPEDWGVSLYADVIITTNEKIEKNPEQVRKFVKATMEGWQYTIENEDEADNITMAYAINSNKEHQKAMLHASVPLINTGDSPIGMMEKTKWENAYKILKENNLIENEFEIEDAYTTQFFGEFEG